MGGPLAAIYQALIDGKRAAQPPHVNLGINGTNLQLADELAEAQATKSDEQLEARAKERAIQFEQLKGELQELNNQLTPYLLKGLVVVRNSAFGARPHHVSALNNNLIKSNCLYR
ncbi:hypothetical protein [Haliea sp. E17]|uniref:hypothetical protein n=1 Tax=Haliea sp. E17 TaxID=3401576 RepID=UPI003AB08BA3